MKRRTVLTNGLAAALAASLAPSAWSADATKISIEQFSAAGKSEGLIQVDKVVNRLQFGLRAIGCFREGLL